MGKTPFQSAADCAATGGGPVFYSVAIRWRDQHIRNVVISVPGAGSSLHYSDRYPDRCVGQAHTKQADVLACRGYVGLLQYFYCDLFSGAIYQGIVLSLFYTVLRYCQYFYVRRVYRLLCHVAAAGSAEIL